MPIKGMIQRFGKVIGMPDRDPRMDQIEAEDGSLIPDWDKVKSVLNPKNWGVKDYTNYGDRGAAYAAARKAGEKEFMWNNKRFNTLNSGTPTQQFNMYGNTNAMVMSKADDKTKEKIIKNSFVGNSMDAEELERRFTLNTLVGTPSYRDGATHPRKEEAYAKFRKQPLEKSKSELMDEYRKIAKIRSQFNPFTNTIYGHNITAEEAHAYRNTEKSEIISFIKDYIKYPFFNEKQQLSGYTNRDHFEFDTHSIVEPVLESYLFGEIEKEDIPIYIKKLREQNQKYLSNKNNLKNTFDTNDLKLFYPYSEKSNKYEILKLQKELSNRGYKLPKSTKKDGTFDGVWGDETKNALSDYQINNYAEGGTLIPKNKKKIIFKYKPYTAAQDNTYVDPKNTIHKTKQGELTKHYNGGTLESIRRIISNINKQ